MSSDSTKTVYKIFRILGPIMICVGIIYLLAGIVLIPIGIILTILGFVRTTKSWDLKQEIKRNNLKDNLKKEIVMASKTYSSVHFKKLAKIIGINDKLLLKTISSMVETNELEATIEFPIIFFKKND